MITVLFLIQVASSCGMSGSFHAQSRLRVHRCVTLWWTLWRSAHRTSCDHFFLEVQVNLGLGAGCLSSIDEKSECLLIPPLSLFTCPVLLGVVVGSGAVCWLGKKQTFIS